MPQIFYRAWPIPPRMSRSEYLRFRLRLLALIVVWAITCIALVIFWGRLPVLLKGLVVVLEYVFGPDLDLIENLFVSYEKYLKNGLW
ncbi:hypothetical protein [Burkholderia sp. Bp9143]|uniref:hypothetical protein n=1 Tax=Burkholderia sp. Bp9143 TaxID=2184574 RepID=UPI000F59B553|nr:hypothetical protein [Burkholderia sp. Bp9143]